ncbi:MAG: hypothetical protein Edafosvirus1_48 [Edafosvirus sp.]|uniref:Uncharacterized protein n=1 Tax=Edafosvirus sp. TaxID=2487765 RepID=A0A3G4ZS45_9VIRU|nr:MAG: hypothetical protein Edafosvirus1_48 [Edafosvirus sp.]
MANYSNVKFDTDGNNIKIFADGDEFEGTVDRHDVIGMKVLHNIMHEDKQNYYLCDEQYTKYLEVEYKYNDVISKYKIYLKRTCWVGSLIKSLKIAEGSSELIARIKFVDNMNGEMSFESSIKENIPFTRKLLDDVKNGIIKDVYLAEMRVGYGSMDYDGSYIVLGIPYHYDGYNGCMKIHFNVSRLCGQCVIL